ncbi:hypothetical protein ACK9YZ_32075 [Rhizobium sp. ZK1]|uniref:hypothetical protein n=1 Tax=Rhizobium sp. ZK1 TaxID=3389872 RepID=UPI0039F6E655
MDPKRRFIGLAAMALSIGLIVMLWSYGLDYLNGTPLEELRYVIFAVVTVGLLSGLQSIFSRFTR